MNRKFLLIFLVCIISLLVTASIVRAGSMPGFIQAKDSLQFVPKVGPFIQIWDDAGDNYNPTVAYNPLHDEYFVVWVTKQDEFSWDIWGRRLRGDGSPIPNGWFNIDTIAGCHLVDPAVVYNPHTDQYLVVYTFELSNDDHDIWGKLVDWNGGLSGRKLIDDRLLKQTDPAVAYNIQDHQYLVTYVDQQASGSWDVYLQSLNEDVGTTITTTIASGSGEYRMDPDVEYDVVDNHYLIVYGHEGTFKPRVLGRTVSANLSSLSPEFHYNDDDVIGYNADISCSLSECLVVWSGYGFNGYVKARRVSRDATPLGPNGGFEIAGIIQNVIQRDPSVSIFSQWGYLITWDSFVTTTADNGNVYGRVVGFGKDQPMGPPSPIDNRQYFEGYSDLACAPTGSCLLVDTHNPLEYPAGDYEVNGCLVYTLQVFLPLTFH